MKRFLLPFLLIIVFSFFSNGQNVGYMGKKMFIKYDAYIMSSFYNPDYFGNTGLLAFNFRNSLGLELVTGRRSSFSLKFQQFDTKFDNSFTYYYYSNNIFFSPFLKKYTPDAPLSINTIGFSFGFSIYGENEIAPLGKYIKIEFEQFFSSTEDLEIKDLNYEQKVPNESPYINTGFSVTWGRNSIINDHIIISTGLQIGLLFSYSPLNILKRTNDWSNSLNHSNYFEESISGRIFSHHLINFNIGVGFF